jgi:hypothetical protein
METAHGRHVVLTPQPATLRVGPIDFFRAAKDCCDAADLLREHSKPYPRVLASFYCQAVELALKAYLLARGDTVRKVKRRRHDLRRLLVDSFALGIDDVVDITPAERKLLIDLSKRYERARLTYFEGASDLWFIIATPPDFDVLAAVARTLVTGIEKGCLDASTGEWRPFGAQDGR